ncbi:MFS transporter, partial [bacterium]|nr:MFS transporter [bacterium]
MDQSSAFVSQRTRLGIVIVAVVAWFFGGVQISITNLALRSAAVGLMEEAGWIDEVRYRELTSQSRTEVLSDSDQTQLTTWNTMATKWYAWFQCAFLFGAAGGGFIFGRLGDILGRTKALALSVSVFSAFTGFSYFVTDPFELLVLRFIACMGIGGTWPNGVALVTEAFSKIAGPIMA